MPSLINSWLMQMCYFKMKLAAQRLSGETGIKGREQEKKGCLEIVFLSSWPKSVKHLRL